MITLAQLNESRLPSRLGLCADDARFLQYVNEAEERLLAMPANWWGTFRTVMFCFQGTCRTWLALPPWVASIRGAWDECCGTGILMRNEWYEMMAPCPGPVPGDCSCCRSLSDAGSTPVVTEPCPPFKVKVLSSPEDDGKKVRVRGVGQDGTGIITDCQDGEELVLDSEEPPVTTFEYGGISGLSKESTCKTVRFEAWNLCEAGTLLNIGEPEEKEITRRKYRLDGECKGTLKAIVKLGHRPVRYPSDRFTLENMPALMDMAESIKAREDRDYERAGVLQASAVFILNAELRNYTSDITEVRWTGTPASANSRVFECFI